MEETYAAIVRKWQSKSHV